MKPIILFFDFTNIVGYLSLVGALALIGYSFYEFNQALKGWRLKDYQARYSDKAFEHRITCLECDNEKIVSQSLPIPFGEFILSYQCKDCKTELYRQRI